MYDVKLTLKLHTTVSADDFIGDAKQEFAEQYAPDGKDIIASAIETFTDEVVPGEYHHRIIVTLRTPHARETMEAGTMAFLAMYVPDGDNVFSAGLDMEFSFVKEGA